jgi:hypothetical protein
MIEALAQRDPNQMDGLKQGYTTGKSRSEHQEHRAIAEVGKAACPTRTVVPANRNVIRVSRAQPAEGKCNRNEQDTTGQRSGTPVERLDQEIDHWRKEERAKWRGGLNDTNGEPPILCVVMLRYQERDDNESTSSLRQSNHNPVPEGELPQVLRNAHAKEAGRHEENPTKNNRARTEIIGQFTEQHAADAPTEHAEHIRHRNHRPRPAEFGFDRLEKQAERIHAD